MLKLGSWEGAAIIRQAGVAVSVQCRVEIDQETPHGVPGLKRWYGTFDHADPPHVLFDPEAVLELPNGSSGEIRMRLGLTSGSGAFTGASDPPELPSFRFAPPDSSDP